jgi:SAM-dependent methyltransferase
MSMQKTLRTARRRLTGDPGAVRYQGIAIPPPEDRQGGRHFQDDGAFVASGAHDASRLEDAFGLTTTSRVLDIGCGNGRLAIGLLHQLGEMKSYTGIDVAARSIDWCDRHIASEHPGMRFIHIDVANERYNPAGTELRDTYRLPLPDESADVIYLYSVFSHMETEDVRIYLGEFARLLASGGGVFLTAFVEHDVEEMAVNPPDYGPIGWEGALHCVRFERAFFERLVSEAGLRVDRLDHRSDPDGQSAIYLRSILAIEDPPCT